MTTNLIGWQFLSVGLSKILASVLESSESYVGPPWPHAYFNMVGHHHFDIFFLRLCWVTEKPCWYLYKTV